MVKLTFHGYAFIIISEQSNFFTFNFS